MAGVTLILVDDNTAANCDIDTDAQPSPILVSTKTHKKGTYGDVIQRIAEVNT